MKNLLFQLIEGPRIKKCVFEHRNAKTSAKENIETTCNFAVSLNYLENENKLEFSLSAQMDEDIFPFMFDIEAQVLLDVPKGLKIEEIKTQAIVSGAPYTYATLRNFIADITRSACVPPYYIPILDINAASKMKIPESKIIRKKKSS